MGRAVTDCFDKARELARAGVDFVCVTLVDVDGHVPQDVGAKALVTAEGLVWGTVGGGRLEARAVEHARGMLADPAEAIACSMRYELLRDLGMVCGGAATLFYEPSVGRRWQIVFFGAGHVVQATVPLVASFDCEVTCIDHRHEWLSTLPARANVRTRLATDLAGTVRELPLGAFVLCITQGHATDLPIVRELLAWGEAGFIGVIGSEPKARALRSALSKEGVSRDALDRVRCPLGLPIGRNDPAEIAVSIAAQLLQERDARIGVAR